LVMTLAVLLCQRQGCIRSNCSGWCCLCPDCYGFPCLWHMRNLLWILIIMNTVGVFPTLISGSVLAASDSECWSDCTDVDFKQCKNCIGGRNQLSSWANEEFEHEGPHLHELRAQCWSTHEQRLQHGRNGRGGRGGRSGRGGQDHEEDFMRDFACHRGGDGSLQKCRDLCKCFKGEYHEECFHHGAYAIAALVSFCSGVCLLASMCYSATVATGLLKDLGLFVSMTGNSHPNIAGVATTGGSPMAAVVGSPVQCGVPEASTKNIT